MFDFESSDPSLRIHEVTGGNVERLDDMLAIFTELLPDYEFSVPVLVQTARRPTDYNPKLVEHQWLVEVGGQPAGMTVFKYMPSRDIGFGLYLGVLPQYRKLGFGLYRRLSELIVAATRIQMQLDALQRGRKMPVGYVAEIVEPKLIARYQEYGFVELPVEYHEPLLPGGRLKPLAPGELETVEFHRVHLGIFPVTHGLVEPGNPTLLQNAVLALLVDHYGVCEEHWAVQHALKSACPVPV